MTDSKNVFDFWSKIKTLDSAKESTKGGCAAAFICAAVTAALAIASQVGLSLIPGLGLSALVDAAIFAGLGWGVRRYSRVCAILVLLFYFLEQYANAANLSSGTAVMAVLFIIFFLQGIRGTFAYHRIKNDPERAPADA